MKHPTTEPATPSTTARIRNRREDFEYSLVADTTSAYLPSTRARLAGRIDDLLIERDVRIEQLQEAATTREAVVERYQLENLELRAYIGRIRNIMGNAVLEAAGPVGAGKHEAVGELLMGALQRAGAVAIPGPGAKPRRPVLLDLRIQTRVQLCATCDDRTRCSFMLVGAAPCGQNAWATEPELEVKG